jgi:arylformamidase
MPKQSVYRDLDQEALDRGYAPSRTVDRLEHYIWLYREQSRMARESFGAVAQLGIAYGPDERHRLDYFPCDVPGAPLIVFIHGGFWQALSKDFASFPAPAMRDAGMNYVALSYRLGQTTGIDGIVDDVQSALRYLGANAANLGFDPSRVVLSGHSAGGHLAGMMLARGDCGDVTIAGAAMIGGVFDLEPVQLSYVNNVMRMDATEAKRNSPVMLAPKIRCPLFITYGEHDTSEFGRQSLLLAEAWQAHMPRIDVAKQLGLNHFNSPMDLADPGSNLFKATAVMAFGQP